MDLFLFLSIVLGVILFYVIIDKKGMEKSHAEKVMALNKKYDDLKRKYNKLYEFYENQSGWNEADYRDEFRSYFVSRWRQQVEDFLNGKEESLSIVSKQSDDEDDDYEYYEHLKIAKEGERLRFCDFSVDTDDEDFDFEFEGIYIGPDVIRPGYHVLKDDNGELHKVPECDIIIEKKHRIVSPEGKELIIGSSKKKNR